jgi:hypothetical protein
MQADTVQKKTKQSNKAVTIPSRFVPKFWADSDSRIAMVKKIRRRCAQIREDAGGHVSVQRDLLCQRIAFLSLVLETQEVRAVEDGLIDLGVYTQATNSLLGLLKTVGLDRHVKSVADLKTYLDERKRK